jgi:hypothetical protein
MNGENKKCIQNFLCERQIRRMDDIQINLMEELLNGNVNLIKKSQCRVKFGDLEILSSHPHLCLIDGLFP